MRTFEIDADEDVPTVTGLVKGPDRAKRVSLVFDTGCEVTQFHIPILEAIGYSAANATAIASMAGVSGPTQQGYRLKLGHLRVLGIDFKNVEVAAFDFENFVERGMEGLLGYDIIRTLNLKLDGPKRLLTVY